MIHMINFTYDSDDLSSLIIKNDLYINNTINEH